MYELTMSEIHLMIYSAIYSMIYSTIHLFQPFKADRIGNVYTRQVVHIHRQKALGCLRPPSHFLSFRWTQGYAPRPLFRVIKKCQKKERQLKVLRSTYAGQQKIKLTLKRELKSGR